MDDVSKLGPLWVNELIHHVQSKRNRVAENMLLIKPDGDYAKQHQMVLDVADAMLAAPDLLDALRQVIEEKAPAYHDCTDNGEPECAWCVARAAIAKATGAAP